MDNCISDLLVIDIDRYTVVIETSHLSTEGSKWGIVCGVTVHIEEVS